MTKPLLPPFSPPTQNFPREFLLHKKERRKNEYKSSQQSKSQKSLSLQAQKIEEPLITQEKVNLFIPKNYHR